MWDSINMTLSGDGTAGESPDTDRALLHAIAAGDVRALEQLYARYALRILRYVLGLVDDRALAEEILQDVMLLAWQRAGQFRGDSSVLTWLLAIARYRAIRARGKRSLAQTPINESMEESMGDADPALLNAIDREGDQRALRLALGSLSAQQRETLELIFYHELSGMEAARVLGVAPGTIKSRLHRALTILRRVMRTENPDVESDHD